MKKSLTIVLLIITPYFIFSQDFQEYDAIGDLSEDVIAVRKNGKWGFIDSNNNSVVDFESKIVAESYWTNHQKESPVFKNGLCIIVEFKDGIPYYGYINKSGAIAIKPQFLNTSNFNDGHAFAQVIKKRVKGKNEYLNKDIITYDFFEAIINTKGEIVKVLREIPYMHLRKGKYKKPYSNSRFIGENMLAVQTKDNQWKIVSFK